jgi:hypothetical protein
MEDYPVGITKLTPPPAAPDPKAAPTVVVEDGTGSNPLANSYTSVVAATTYLAGILNASPWGAATPDQQSISVINATRSIDNSMNFNGYIVSATQPLKWPRLYCPNPEIYAGYPYSYPYPISLGFGYGYYPSDQIPLILAQATALQAMEMLRTDRITENTAKGIKSMHVEVIDLVFKDGAQSNTFIVPLFSEVQRMLSVLGADVTAGWGTAAVQRTM